MPVSRRRTVLLGGLLVWAVAAGAQSAPQQPSPQPQAQAAKPKPKKVFTEDDLKSVRKPWDDYADQKQAAEAASQARTAPATAKAGETQSTGVPVDPKTGKPYLDPDSPEAIQREVTKWENELKRNEQLMDDARREMSEAADQGHWDSAKAKLEIYEKNELDIKQLIQKTRAQLAEAQKRKQEGSKPAGVTTPPQPSDSALPPAAPPQP